MTDVTAAWEDFCDRLKASGNQILRPEAPSDEFNRAEGYRYLTRLLRIGLEMHLEFSDPDFPGFFLPSHETAKIGADNPDNLYMSARLNGKNEYVLHGQRNTVHYLSFRTQKGGYESDGKMTETGFLDSKTIQLNDDGSFDIVLSQTPKPGNWLPIDPDTNMLTVRQTFHDRQQEKPATLKIERLNADDAPEPLTPEKLIDSLNKTVSFVEGTSNLFANWSQSYLERPNELPAADQQLCQSVGGDPNIYYYHSYWELEDDEALLIEVNSIPECETWNLQVNNYWMESLDYRYHKICINKHTADYKDDGSVTMVLTHEDPGCDNWLETAGHKNGTLCFRWVGAKEMVDPEVRVVKLNELNGGRS